MLANKMYESVVVMMASKVPLGIAEEGSYKWFIRTQVND